MLWCLTPDANTTRENYKALRVAMQKLWLPDACKHLEPHICRALGPAPIKGTGVATTPPASDDERVATLLEHLSPVFKASSEIITAFNEDLERCVRHRPIWSLSEVEPEKITANNWHAQIETLLAQFVRAKLPIRDIQNIFRALCILNQRTLDTPCLRDELNGERLDDHPERQRWTSAQAVARTDAKEICRSLIQENVSSGRWLSPYVIVHVLAQCQASQMLNAAVESLSRSNLIALFDKIVDHWPEEFTASHSTLLQVLHTQTKFGHKLTAKDAQRIRERAQMLREVNDDKTNIKTTV